ncbi:MAG: zinc ABC transporter substrate-binding protein [Cytophagaceae bacterium]|nr:zinc ABC transporter substrate-binding protein [Cytophagaceae bacterium]
MSIEVKNLRFTKYDLRRALFVLRKSYFVLFILLLGCGKDPAKKTSRLKIVATTGMIGDAVKNITGDSAEVFVLMGPGVDPHLYKPTLRDIDELSDADIIVYNGLHLEGKMGEILEKISLQKKVICLKDGIPEEKFIISNPNQVKEGDHAVYDPHIWFDISIWNAGVKHLGKELANEDPAHSQLYLKNLSAYSDRLEKLDRWTKENIATVPKTQRVLITAHDAFTYFGKAYDIEVMGLQGISTVAEPGLKDITNLVKLIAERKIKAVFVESSVSEKAINAVIQGCMKRGQAVKIGGTLFSDAMGAKGTEEGTYVGMVRYNVRMIVNGLK